MRPTPDGWPDDLTVTSPRVEVVLGGESYPVESVTVRAELTTDLPEPIAEAPGESVPSASIVVRAPGLVLPRDPSPWLDEWIGGMWGQSCTVRMGHGDALVDVFTGQIAEVDGSTGDATISVEVDGQGAWSRDPAAIWPMSATHHHESQPVYRVGLSPLTVLDRLARGGGWHSCPEPTATTVLHIPMQGSLLPEIGDIGYSLDSGDGEGPVFEAAPWGWGVWQSDDMVDVDATPVSGMVRPVPSASIQMTVWMDPDAATEFHTWEMTSAPGGGVAMTVWPDFDELEVSAAQGAESIVISRVGLPAGPYTVRADPEVLTLTLPDGTTHTADVTGWGGSYGQVGSFLGWGRMGSAKVDTSVRGSLPDPPTLGTWAPTFVADPSLADIEVSPWIDGRVRWDVMTEIVSAEGGALLESGDGVLRFVNRDRLVGQPADADVGVENLAALRWKMLASGLATSVRVGYSTFEQVIDDQPTIYLGSPFPSDENVKLWRNANPTRRYFDLEVDAVFGLDRDLSMHTQLSDPTHVGTSASAFREETGIVSGTTIGNVNDTYMSWSMEQISPTRVYIEVAWEPRGAWMNSDFITFFMGPWLRAYQTITWLDDEEVTIDTGVPLARGTKEISIPASPWRQNRRVAEQWAQVLALQAGRQAPVIDQATMATPDPRLEVGDVVRVFDPEVTGVQARALIIGNDLTYDPDSGLSQTLRLRLLPWTFDDFNDVWAGATLDDFNAAWGPSATFDDFNADPLRME